MSQSLTYAIPNDFMKSRGFEDTSFHGTSHKIVSEIAVMKLVAKSQTRKVARFSRKMAVAWRLFVGENARYQHGIWPMNAWHGTRAVDIRSSVIFHLVNEGARGGPLVIVWMSEFDLEQQKKGMLGLNGIQRYADIRKNIFMKPKPFGYQLTLSIQKKHWVVCCNSQWINAIV